MAPRIGKGGVVGENARSDSAPSSEPAAAGAATPATRPAPRDMPAMAVSSTLREALYEMKRYVEANAENVGDKFADEARKIHSGEAEERNIYGDTTADEAEALEEEGVPFGRIPWPKATDA